MFKKLSTKISFATSIVVLVIITVFTVYLIKDRTREMNTIISEKAIAATQTGKTIIENLIENLIDDDIFTESHVFDQTLIPVELPDNISDKYKDVASEELGTIRKYNYTTGFDSYLDNILTEIQDQFLEDPQVVYAVLVDKQGYLPTHNMRYRNALTGDFVSDRDNNRTKRIFNDEVGKNVSKNSKDSYLKQVYRRDTGEVMWDISAPVFVKGKYWGAFRVGLSMEKTRKTIASLRRKLIIFMIVLLIVIILIISQVTSFMMRELKNLHTEVGRVAKGDFSARQEVKSNDEISDLSKAFNKMVKDLDRYIRELEETTRAKERVEKELDIARDIQQDIIPKIFPAFPDKPELDIYALLVPARAVGGDLYDFFFVEENKLCFVMGDVSDKGVPASLFMAVAKTLIKSTAKEFKSPEEIMRIVNNELSLDNDSCMFVTVFCGILDLETGEVSYANAGHNPPIIITKGDDVRFLAVEHTPAIGVLEDVVFHKATFKLEPLDVIYLYTDGVTEAFDNDNQMFGEDRLKDMISGNKDLAVKDLVKGSLQTVETFAKGAPQSDDITIMAIRYLGTEEGQKEQE